MLGVAPPAPGLWPRLSLICFRAERNGGYGICRSGGNGPDGRRPMASEVGHSRINDAIYGVISPDIRGRVDFRAGIGLSCHRRPENEPGGLARRLPPKAQVRGLAGGRGAAPAGGW